MKIYFDNAATTPIDPQVIDIITDVMKHCYGNPSSVHGHGRTAKAYLERSRRKIAELLNVSPSEIIFTSGGTEADNMAIRKCVDDLGITHIISSKIEHHAVTHTVEEMAHQRNVKVSWVNIDEEGRVDLHHLESLLKENQSSLITLMHANNEIGTMLPLKEVSELKKKYNAIFHSDTVQTMGHFAIDLKQLDIDMITCSAHKLHGPKGIGFLYLSSNISLHPFITGGAQERNMRAGTENIYGIVGLAKALELSYADMHEHETHVRGLKNYMKRRLMEEIEDIRFNGDASNDSLYTVLNVSFPPVKGGEMFLMKLDIMGISVSGGSACSSGSSVGSHVLAELNVDPNRPNVRFSFSRYNTRDEIEHVVGIIKKMYSPSTVTA
jgi:cysteine desulfurase